MSFFDFGYEKRSVQTLDDFPPSIVEMIRSKSGLTNVNNRTALQLATYYSCVDVISKVKAGLPVAVYKKVKVGEFTASVKLTDHKVSKLLKLRPNPEMSSFVMTRTGTTQAINGGNSFRFIDRSLAGIKNIWFLDASQIKLKRSDPTQRNARGRLYYEDTETKRQYKPEDILHLMGFTQNGLWGDPMVAIAKKVLSLGIEMASFQNNFFENGLNPGGVFEHPASLGENKNSFLAAVKKRFGGNQKSKGPMTLEDGMTFKAYDVKMVDQQFIELLKINQIDISGMMGVPLSMISVSDSNTNYNNTESENIRFMKTGLAPWVIPDEQEMSWKLLTEKERDDGLYIKYNFDGFLRGDAKTQSELSKTWFDMGVPVNQLLTTLDRNPVPGGDQGLVQLNLTPLLTIGQAQDIDESQRDNSITIETRATTAGNIKVRDRIKDSFTGKFHSAFKRVLEWETENVLKVVSKNEKRERRNFDSDIDDIYKGFEEIAMRNLSPVFSTFAKQIFEVMGADLNIEDMPDELRTEINDFTEKFILDYKSSSIGQLKQQNRKEELEGVTQRIAEWNEGRTEEGLNTKPIKNTNRNIQSLDNMVALGSVWAIGLYGIWRNRRGSCQFCKQLNGKRIKRGQSFVKSGSSLKSNNDDTDMKPSGKVTYPQLHRNCHCYISW